MSKNTTICSHPAPPLEAISCLDICKCISIKSPDKTVRIIKQGCEWVLEVNRGKQLVDIEAGPGISIKGKGTVLDPFVVTNTVITSGLADRYYLHNQGVASTTWVVPHSLGKFPSVTVVDSAGTEVEGDITHNSINQCTLTFAYAFAGKAYIN